MTLKQPTGVTVTLSTPLENMRVLLPASKAAKSQAVRSEGQVAAPFDAPWSLGQWPRLSLNLRSSCLGFLNIRIAHAQTTPHLPCCLLLASFHSCLPPLRLPHWTSRALLYRIAGCLSGVLWHLYQLYLPWVCALAWALDRCLQNISPKVAPKLNPKLLLTQSLCDTFFFTGPAFLHIQTWVPSLNLIFWVSGYEYLLPLWGIQIGS